MCRRHVHLLYSILCTLYYMLYTICSIVYMLYMLYALSCIPWCPLSSLLWPGLRPAVQGKRLSVLEAKLYYGGSLDTLPSHLPPPGVFFNDDNMHRRHVHLLVQEACTPPCVYVGMCMYTCAYMYIYIHIHVSTHKTSSTFPLLWWWLRLLVLAS